VLTRREVDDYFNSLQCTEAQQQDFNTAYPDTDSPDTDSGGNSGGSSCGGENQPPCCTSSCDWSNGNCPGCDCDISTCPESTVDGVSKDLLSKFLKSGCTGTEGTATCAASTCTGGTTSACPGTEKAAKSGASVCETPSLFVADNRFKYMGKQHKCSGITEAVKITQQQSNGQSVEVSIDLMKNYAQFHWHNATCADFTANLKVDTITMGVLRDCCSDGKDTCFTVNSLSPSPSFPGLSIVKATPSASDEGEEFVFDGLNTGTRGGSSGNVAVMVVITMLVMVLLYW